MNYIICTYPWLVLEIDNCMAGYAYASQYSEREAYQWSVNLSVYLKSQYHRNGYGSALYRVLLELLKFLGYCNVYGGITLPNTGSVKLHESFFFNPVGTYRHVGYKNGKWHDVIWYERIIRNINEMPDKPTPLKDADYKAINSILNSSF